MCLGWKAEQKAQADAGSKSSQDQLSKEKFVGSILECLKTCAKELYWHRVLQRSTRTVKAGIYLLWQYKVCWTPETSDVVHGRVAKRVVDCLRRNEGLYVKFGQAMSTMET